MHRIINPFRYNGSLTISSSKSIFQRALALACFSDVNFHIKGDSYNEDSKVAKEICKKIGFDVIENDNELDISGNMVVEKKSIIINSGESGLSLRLFGVLLSSFFDNVEICPSGTAKNRSFDFSALSDLGVESFHGDCSIILKGRLKPGTIYLNQPKTSQLLTGLLITLPFLNGDSIIYCNNLVSKPYIDITLDLLADFGVQILNDNYKKFSIKGNQVLKKKEIIIEGDWSNAAFHFVGAAISGKVNVYGLNLQSFQGDKQILNILENCGAKVIRKKHFISVSKHKLKSFSYDATDTPDLIPPLTVLASCCKGNSKIFGTNRLINKESNRALTLQNEFNNLGIDISLENNYFNILGTDSIKGNLVDSHNDHRIAMALSIMATVSKNPVAIKDGHVVDKSYSRFYRDLEDVSIFN